MAVERRAQDERSVSIMGEVVVDNPGSLLIGHRALYHDCVILVVPRERLIGTGSENPGNKVAVNEVPASEAPVNEVPVEKAPDNVLAVLEGLEEKRGRRLSHMANVLTERARLFLRRFQRWPLLLVPVSFAVAAMLAATLAVVFSVRAARAPDNVPDELQMVTRDEWLARPEKAQPDVLETPVEWVIVHHTQTTTCSSRPQCCKVVKDIQYQHMTDPRRRWFDIGYNFLVGGDGLVYEGRGWDSVGAHTKTWNFKSVGVALIGNFKSTVLPTPQQVRAVELLARRGVALGKLVEEHALVGRCQLQQVDSPGQNVMERLRKMDHWRNHSTATSAC